MVGSTRCIGLRLATLESGEVRLDRVILSELGFDIVIDRDELLNRSS